MFILHIKFNVGLAANLLFTIFDVRIRMGSLKVFEISTCINFHLNEAYSL